jgi:FAD/FMN-containing dehydrogenase
MTDLEASLKREIQGEVRFDKISRALYSTDASVYQIQPVGVVVPKNREDIVRAAAICRAARCPVTMRGGGTSQAGQAIGRPADRHFEVLLQYPRSQRRGALGARRARHRSR